MAITKIYAIRSRLDRRIDYAVNHEKTALDARICYAVNPKKTEQLFFADTIAYCERQRPQMRRVAAAMRKLSGHP